MKLTSNLNTILLFLILDIYLHGCGASQPAQSPLKEITTSSGVVMILVPSGEFVMGDNQGNPDEQPARKVSISGFALDKTEVTQTPYEQLMLAAPSHFKGPDNPVEQVRWSDAALFCNARSRQEGLEPCYNEETFECNFGASGYRLPTEAEWEYACRAGTDTAYDFGNDARKLAQYAWFAGNSQKKTTRVGGKKANAWGFVDLYGNVYEWCNDRYGETYYQTGPAQDPRGPDQGEKRVLRGGSWNSSAEACRAAARLADDPGITDACFARDTYGFRCARKLTPEEAKTLALPAASG